MECLRGSLTFYFDRVIRQVNKREMGKGMKLRDKNGGGWEFKKVLYAEYTVLVDETRDGDES